MQSRDGEYRAHSRDSTPLCLRIGLRVGRECARVAVCTIMRAAGRTRVKSGDAGSHCSRAARRRGVHGVPGPAASASASRVRSAARMVRRHVHSVSKGTSGWASTGLHGVSMGIPSLPEAAAAAAGEVPADFSCGEHGRAGGEREKGWQPQPTGERWRETIPLTAVLGCACGRGGGRGRRGAPAADRDYGQQRHLCENLTLAGRQDRVKPARQLVLWRCIHPPAPGQAAV